MGKVLKMLGGVIRVLLSDAVHRLCRKKCFSSFQFWAVDVFLPVGITGWLRPLSRPRTNVFSCQSNGLHACHGFCSKHTRFICSVSSAVQMKIV